MDYLRLRDPLLAVLFEDDDIVAIDKPYGFNAHTNDSKLGDSDSVEDGLIEIYGKNRGQKLHIIHRLDQTTTGVMIFGKSVDSAKKYAQFFFDRQVKKTYWFLTKSASTQPSFLIDDVIVHKGRELDAKTQLTLIKKSSSIELWQANPFTGRNHQIRIHAKAAKISILGDRSYDGAPFPFLCLHNHRIEFPNGVSITSRPPIYFENAELLENEDLATALFESDRRRRMFANASNQCFRMVHSSPDQPGFRIDEFGDVLFLNWLKRRWTESEHETFQKFSNIENKPIFAVDGSAKISGELSIIAIRPANSTREVATAWTAKENKISFELRTDLGLSAGLSLNQRLQRNWLFHNASEKSVLSLFASTGGFAIAAALGGAKQVTAIEAGSRALTAAKKNMELNSIDPEKIKFLRRESLTFLEQSLKTIERYDLIVCEAPTFLKGEKKTFKIKTDLESLLKSCFAVLKPNGSLLFSTTFEGFKIEDIEKSILKSQAALKIPKMKISSILPSMDFELPSEDTALKSFLIEVGIAKEDQP